MEDCEMVDCETNNLGTINDWDRTESSEVNPCEMMGCENPSLQWEYTYEITKVDECICEECFLKKYRYTNAYGRYMCPKYSCVNEISKGKFGLCDSCWEKSLCEFCGTKLGINNIFCNNRVCMSIDCISRCAKLGSKNLSKYRNHDTLPGINKKQRI